MSNQKVLPIFPIKKSQTPNELYKSFSYFRYIFQLFGMFPVYEEKGSIKFSWTSAITIYTITFHTISIGLTCVWVWLFFHKSNQDNLKEKDIFFLSWICVVIIGSSIPPKLTLLDIHNVVEFNNRFQSMVNLNRQLTNKRNLRLAVGRISKKNFCYLFLLCFSLISIFYFTYYFYTTFNGKLNRTSLVIIMLQYHVCSYYLIFYGIVWYYMNQIISNYSEQLFDDFKAAELTRANLKSYRILWVELSKIINILGETFRWTIISFYTGLLLTNLFGLYFMVSELMQGKVSYTDILSSAMGLMYVNFFSEISHQTVSKAKDKYLDHVIYLLEHNDNIDIRRELRQFYSYLVFNSPQISLGGYFVLDRKLTISVLSGFVTYLVIFLQMTPAGNSGTRAKQNNINSL